MRAVLRGLGPVAFLPAQQIADDAFEAEKAFRRGALEFGVEAAQGVLAIVKRGVRQQVAEAVDQAFGGDLDAQGGGEFPQEGVGNVEAEPRAVVAAGGKRARRTVSAVSPVRSVSRLSESGEAERWSERVSAAYRVSVVGMSACPVSMANLRPQERLVRFLGFGDPIFGKRV